MCLVKLHVTMIDASAIVAVISTKRNVLGNMNTYFQGFWLTIRKNISHPRCVSRTSQNRDVFRMSI